MPYTEEQMDKPGCHGFGTRREQFADRDKFIADVKQAPTMAALGLLAREVPNLVHNVSAAPVAEAVETRAQELVPIEGGYLIEFDGRLEARQGR